MDEPMLEHLYLMDEIEDRHFLHPACKQTFESLPRIYGRKKKGKAKLIPLVKAKLQQKQSIQSSQEEKGRLRFHNGQVAQKLSKPKYHKCEKKSCLCHYVSDEDGKVKKKTERKLTFRQGTRVRVPEMKKFNLDEIQTFHKVSFKKIHQNEEQRSSGLAKIIEEERKKREVATNHFENQKMLGVKRRINSLPNENFQTQSKKLIPIDKGKTEGNTENSEETRLNKYRKLKEMKDCSIQIDTTANNKEYEESDGENYRLAKKTPLKNMRFKTESSNMPSERSGIALSANVLRSHQQQNTQFHILNKSIEKSSEKSSMKRSQLSVKTSYTRFKVPEQKQYFKFLSQYRSLNPEFNVKQLVKSNKFTIVKEEKSVYFGEIDEEQYKNGRGIRISERQIFQGQFAKDMKIHGYQRTLQGTFKGQFVNGLRSGSGFLKLINGETFEGTWKNGKKNGFFKWTSPTGATSEGQWKNDMQSGKGIFKHKKSTYRGQFQNFLKHGFGQQKFANGDFYKGQYKNGKPDGRGLYEWSNGGKYEGSFKFGMREGIGKMVDEDGTVYEGNFKEDFKDGEGKQYYPSGEHYEGQFEKGVRLNGKLYNSEGLEIEIILR